MKNDARAVVIREIIQRKNKLQNELDSLDPNDFLTELELRGRVDEINRTIRSFRNSMLTSKRFHHD